MTVPVRDAVLSAEVLLRDAGIPDPRREAELLLARVLGGARERLLAHPDGRVSEAGRLAYAGLVSRRAGREPFAYLVGEKEFYGRPFIVSPDVLIPRPETETLVEAVLNGFQMSDFRRQASIIDIGAGSGAIGLTLAAELPGARAVLADVSGAALAVARRNAERLGLAARTAFETLDVFSPNPPLTGTQAPKTLVRAFSGAEPVVLTANLPYLAASVWERTGPEVRDHEPRLALVSGSDGLDHYRALMERLKERSLEPDLVAFEADPHQMPELERMVKNAFRRHCTEIRRDLHGDLRVLIAKRGA
jgi:release factor glutamine methyltransferase